MPQPPNWEPPYPAFSAKFELPSDSIVIAYYGVEYRADISSNDLAAFHSWMASMLELPSRPDVINRARCSAGDLMTDVFSLYWLDSLRFTQWECFAQHTSWWNDRERVREAAGYWREIWRSPHLALRRYFPHGIALDYLKEQNESADRSANMPIGERRVTEFPQKLNFRLHLNLWHEVAVLPEGMAMGEYVNCNPTSGMLPCFPAESL